MPHMHAEVGDMILLLVTGGSAFGKNTSTSDHPTDQEVARLAYEFYSQRGRQHGGDIDDWLRAERVLRRHFASVR